MDSALMTVATIALVWGIALFAIYSRNKKIKEEKARRDAQYQEELYELNQRLSEQGSTPSVEPLAKKSTTPAPKPIAPPTPPSIEPSPPKQVSSQEHLSEYASFLVDRYEKLGYSIWDHKEDIGIDIIAKKQKELLLIACRYWDKNQNHSIGVNDIKAFRIDASDFIECNPVFANYDSTLLLILSKEKIDNQAKEYIQKIQEQGKKIAYQVILF